MDKICLIPGESLGEINRNIYGHFSEHIGGVFRDGLWVGPDSNVPNIRGWRKFCVEKFAAIDPPILRWPGGCFAETYDWRDGIGDPKSRRVTANWWYTCDKRVETNEVGTHEFTDFCRLTGAEPYFAANLASSRPLDIREWMEYCNFPEGSTTLARQRGENGSPAPLDVRCWGIGNENWGGGGGMTPEMYAREFVRYAELCSTVNVNGSHWIACGASGGDVDWTDRFMREYAGKCSLYALSFHYYCGGAGSVTDFTETEWYKLLSQARQMKKFVGLHRAAMLAHDPEGRVKMACDEWGCWHEGGSGPSKGGNLFEQQSTLRDAAVTALTLDIFNNNCDAVVMANAAQLCNNLHCLFLCGGEHEIVTPTYYVYDLYKGHQGGKQVRVAFDEADDDLTASASVKDGKLTLTVSNLSYSEAKKVEISQFGPKLAGKASLTSLAGDPHDHNTFEEPDKVRLSQTVPAALKAGKLTVELAPASVNLIEIQ